MKLIQLMAVATIACAPVTAAYATPTPANGDTLTVNSAVPSTCALTGPWAFHSGGGSSFSGTSSGGTFTFSNNQLVTADGHSLYTLSFVTPTIYVTAPLYCNSKVTAQVHATNGALRYTGTPPGGAWGYFYPESVNFGIDAGTPASQPSAINSGLGSCSTGGTICSSTFSNTAGNTGTLTVQQSDALTAGTVFLRYSLVRQNNNAQGPLMVAGAYSETLVLTITPQ
jgi:hypothetical protein